MRYFGVFFVVAVLLLTCGVSAPAATVYTDRATWASQVSGITTIDFDSLAGQQFATLTLGDVTFDVPGSPDGGALWVSSPGSYTPIGAALVGNHWMTTIRGMVNPSTTAVGADIANISIDDTLQVNVDINGTWQLWNVQYTYPNAVFFGIVAGAGETIEGISFGPTVSNWVAVDNFSYGAGTPPIPEPASLLLLGTGLSLGALVLRRKR